MASEHPTTPGRRPFGTSENPQKAKLTSSIMHSPGSSKGRVPRALNSWIGVPPLWTSSASERDTPLPNLTVGKVKIGLPGAAVRRLLPAAGDRVAIITDRRAEALRERFALAPELPLPVSDAHLVDAADAALVGVELEVGPVRGVASHDRDAVRCLGHLHRRTLDQVCSRVVPFDRGP